MGNREFDKAVEKIGEYLRKFSGSKPSFSDTSTSDNLWASTTVSHSGISSQVIVTRLKNQSSIEVLFSSASVKIPQENLVAFFRQLLVWNYFATDMGHFALDESTGIISLVLRRPFEGFDYSEFKKAVEAISIVNMNCLVMLKKSFPV